MMWLVPISRVFSALAVFYVFWWYAKRRKAVKAQLEDYKDLEQVPKIAFGLYLRAFEHDGSQLDDYQSVLLANPAAPTSYEESLALELYNYTGLRILKVKDPRNIQVDRSVSEVALSVTEETWKEQVHELMRLSPIIFLKPSSSAGLEWELQQLKAKGYLDKTVILMNFGQNENDPREVRQLLRERFLARFWNFSYEYKEFMRAALITFDDNRIICHRHLRQCNIINKLKEVVDDLKRHETETLLSYLEPSSWQYGWCKLLAANELQRRGVTVELEAIGQKPEFQATLSPFAEVMTLPKV